jgi:uncharacterized protein (UPF0303 family)
MSAGNFTSERLFREKFNLKISTLTVKDAITIGEIGIFLGRQRKLPIAIEVRIGNWIVFRICLPGSKPDNIEWINRKAEVVKSTQNSSMFERISALERGVDWFKEHNVTDETHAIHGGAVPLFTDEGFKGILIISGLSQEEDHLLAVEVITEFLALVEK